MNEEESYRETQEKRLKDFLTREGKTTEKQQSKILGKEKGSLGKGTKEGRSTRKHLATELLLTRSRRDVQTERQRTSEAESRVRTDELTGLLRKFQFTDALKRTLKVFKSTHENQSDKLGVEQVRDFAILACDLDMFSWWNDALQSHGLGDLVLKELGQFFLDNLKERDIKTSRSTSVRSGGEEFAHILENPGNKENAQAIAERLVKKARDHLLDAVIENQLIAQKDRIIAESVVLNSDKATPQALESVEKVDQINEVIREAIMGMKNLQENHTISVNVKGEDTLVNAREYFLSMDANVKGSRERKLAFLDMINQFFKGNLGTFSQEEIDIFLNNSGSYQTLINNEQRRSRNEFEQKFASHIIPKLFGNITLSVGLVYVDENFPKDDLTQNILKGIADNRMYLAKQTGRNRVCYFPGSQRGLKATMDEGKPIDTSPID